MKNSNKQTQNVKVVVNNSCCDKPKRRRRKPAPRQETPPENMGEMPMPVPPMPQFATGISPYANRPMTFAPSVQMIQADNGLRVPAYFEKPYTNREASLAEMRRALASELEDVKEALFSQVANPQQASQAQNAVSSLATSVMSAMDMAAPSLPSVAGGVGSVSSPTGSSLPDPPHIPQGASGIDGVPQPQQSVSTPPSSSQGSGSGGSGGSSGGGGRNGSESTVQGGKPPSESSQGILPQGSLPLGTQLTAQSGVVGLPLPQLSSGGLTSMSVNQPSIGGLEGLGSASGVGGYGGIGSVNMSDAQGSVAPPFVGVQDQIFGSGGSGSVGSRPAPPPPLPNPQDVIYGSSGSEALGSRVAGSSQPRQLPGHPYWEAMEAFNYMSSITDERARKTIAKTIKKLATNVGINVSGRHLSTILSMLELNYNEALSQQQ
jgi:hypothetical protein